MKLNKLLKATLMASTLAVGLSSCTTMATYAGHKDLSIESKMSSSVFLDPAPKAKKIMFVEVRNTTTEDTTGLADNIKKQLTNNGWTITDDSGQAFYMLQVNVLQAGLAKNHDAADSYINQGFTSIAGGAAIGTAVGFLANDGMAGGVVGLSVAGADYIGSQLLKDKTYSIVTDIQVGEKTDAKISEQTNASLANGSSSTSQSFADTTDWKKTRVRVGTIADQINLKIETAMPQVQEGLAKEIAGIFS
jgi:hypothetical protein